MVTSHKVSSIRIEFALGLWGSDCRKTTALDTNTIRDESKTDMAAVLPAAFRTFAEDCPRTNSKLHGPLKSCSGTTCSANVNHKALFDDMLI